MPKTAARWLQQHKSVSNRQDAQERKPHPYDYDAIRTSRQYLFEKPRYGRQHIRTAGGRGSDTGRQAVSG